MKKSDAFIAVALVASFLIFAAWVVNRRVGEVDLLPTPNEPAQFSNSELNLPSTSFTPPLSTDGTAKLPILSKGMPEFAGIATWLNSDPLAQEDLRGKVVLIDFWTYSCINCIRTLPYITSWYDKYEKDGFVIIGVHTPEFAFEKKTENVADAIKKHGIHYPVALDNSYATWTAYDNHYWPAHYLFDAKGQLRFTHFGEGKYAETEEHIVSLLKEAGYTPGGEITEVESNLDFQKIGTPETYVGYGRMAHLGSPEPVLKNQVATYSAPAQPAYNSFYFSGKWLVESERAVASEEGARIIYRYKASAANLVMGPPEGGSGRVRITVDGKVTQTITVDAETLYVLHETPGVYDTHTIEIEFLDVGTSAYAFTFG